MLSKEQKKERTM